MIQFNLGDDQLQSVVGEAILRSVDDRTREALIAQAIGYLLTKGDRPSPEGRCLTPLQEAFNHALVTVARKLIEEELDRDAILRRRLRDLIAEGYDRMLTQRREETLDAFAQAFVAMATRGA